MEKLSSAPALSSVLVRKLSDITKIPPEELTVQLREYKQTGSIKTPLHSSGSTFKKDDGQQSQLTEAIKLLLRKPELALDDSLNQKLAEIEVRGIEFLIEIVKYIQSNPSTTIAGITENYRDREKIRNRLIELAPSESQYGDADFSDESIRDSFLDSMNRLKEITIDSRLREFGNLSNMDELTEEKKREWRLLLEAKKQLKMAKS